MYKELVEPNVKNLIISLRDLGYNLEIAVADILDNSITAKAKNIDITSLYEINPYLIITDDGVGMSEEELVEAMRFGSKNPLDMRSKDDLGRFGLGLKTASFSQCKKLTVITKKNGIISNRQWDLDYIEKENKWYLNKLDNLDEYSESLKKLSSLKSGTIVIWEEIDRFSKDELEENLYKLRKHLALVFHRFLEKGKISIFLNNKKIDYFNPFNIKSMATQELETIEVPTQGNIVRVKPFILPHHSKVSQEEYRIYETEEGYLKSQGFYLYRANRLLIHGTWFGLHKIADMHKLVRIQIDIPNDSDIDWGIDIKKSKAKPAPYVKNYLKNIVAQVKPMGSRPYTGRGKKIEDKRTDRFWLQELDENKKIKFKLNKENKLYETLIDTLNEEQKELFKIYTENVESYIPLDSILVQLQQNPHEVKQKEELGESEKIELINKLKELGLDEAYINTLECIK